MAHTPNAEELIPLPDFYVFKVFVKKERLTGEQLMAITAETLGRELEGASIGKTASRTGKYFSFSLNVYLLNHDEREKLYRVYAAHTDIVMVL